jgi:ribonuclease-3
VTSRVSAGPAGNSDASHPLTLALGVTMSPALLEQALTHRSYAYEHGGLPTNERLEFLGDSVLGLVITEALYRSHPDLPEGQLAKLRSAVVNMRALAGVGRGLGLGEYLRLGKGEESTGGRDKASILADGVEALIGAVYVDRGVEAATQVVHTLFDPLLERAPHLGAGLDWKTSLQELTAALDLGVPEYRIAESGPDHAKSFVATVVLRDGPHGSGQGRSKKEAEQEAAAATWEGLAARSTTEA